MLSRMLEGVNRSLAYKLMLAHIIIIAISNYIVQFKFTIFGRYHVLFDGLKTTSLVKNKSQL